jgi:hypothetical protein
LLTAWLARKLLGTNASDCVSAVKPVDTDEMSLSAAIDAAITIPTDPSIRQLCLRFLQLVLGLSKDAVEMHSSTDSAVILEPAPFLAAVFADLLPKAFLESDEHGNEFTLVLKAVAIRDSASMQCVLDSVIKVLNALHSQGTADTEFVPSAVSEALTRLLRFLTDMASAVGGEGSSSSEPHAALGELSDDICMTEALEIDESAASGNRAVATPLISKRSLLWERAVIDGDCEDADSGNDDDAPVDDESEFCSEDVGLDGAESESDDEEDVNGDHDEPGTPATAASKPLQCTFCVTGSNFVEQHWCNPSHPVSCGPVHSRSLSRSAACRYHCYTCSLTFSEGCCSVCIKVCCVSVLRPSVGPLPARL